MQLDDLLKLAMKKGASDLHLKAGAPPMIRKKGEIRRLSSQLEALSPRELDSMAMEVMDHQQTSQFIQSKDVDVSYGISGIGRFRINIFRQRGTVRMVIRNIPDRVPSIEELNLPDIMKGFAEKQRGLTLITGATGSGKSSTLAALINFINMNHNRHIIMIEDPTEFLIRDLNSIISQRELGIDTPSYASSLRAALRQDPDVILIGEMRDKETIEIALQAAETGHLVFSTLHTTEAHETINRILSVFDSAQQMQIRLQLASVLNSIVSQRLVKSVDGSKFYPALEILVNNKRVSDMICNPNETNKILDAIEEGKNMYGMVSFDQSLMDLISEEKITYQEALKQSTNPENFEVRYNGITHMDGKGWSNKDKTHIKKRMDDSWQNIQEVEMELTKTHVAANSDLQLKDLDKTQNMPSIMGLKKKFKKHKK